MIAEAVKVTRTEIASEGLYAAVPLIVGQQERCIVDPALGQKAGRGSVGNDMVEAAPLPPESVGAPGAMAALGIGRYVVHAVAKDELDILVGGHVVKVAHDEYSRIGR